MVAESRAGVGEQVELDALDTALFDDHRRQPARRLRGNALPGMRRRRFVRLLYVSSIAAIVSRVHGAARGRRNRQRDSARWSPRTLAPGWFGRPEEVAEVADAVLGNAYVTGQMVQVNGGVYQT
jgi:NAD(P)-dependent dehydrogenase (short-subunit alcohol dehydrogenase family)